MIIKNPPNALFILLIFLGSLGATFLFTSAHKSLEYEARYSEYRYQTARRHQVEIDELKAEIVTLNLRVEKMGGLLAACQSSGGKNVTIDQR
jgi:hypothetical protein